MKKKFSLVVVSFLIATCLGLSAGCTAANKAVSPEEIRFPSQSTSISKLVLGPWDGYYGNIRITLAGNQKEYPAWVEIEEEYITYSQTVGNVKYRVPLEVKGNQFIFRSPTTNRRIILTYDEANDELVGWRGDESVGNWEGWRWHFKRRGVQKVGM